MNHQKLLLLATLLLGQFYLGLFQMHADECDACRDISSNIIKLLDKSEEDNFGGGNTDFEVNKMGSFKTSETRLMEIMDGLFKQFNQNPSLKVIQSLEDKIEEWWIKEYRQNTSARHNLAELLCLDKFCCPWGHYGLNCEACPKCMPPGGSCEGNGTRSGNGECLCNYGYSADGCDSCDPNVAYQDGAYCHLCDNSCKGCLGNAVTCLECSEGYEKANDTSSICVDVDECAKADNSSVCAVGEYCVNELGSHSCKKCSENCLECANEKNCSKCAEGYVEMVNSMDPEKSQTTCGDVDECIRSDTCEAGKVCVNTPGSYLCKDPKAEGEEKKPDEEPILELPAAKDEL